MSRALAIEVGKNNITVNNVLPGWIATASQTEGEAQGGLNTPLGRSADATEVANAIVFLASRENHWWWMEATRYRNIKGTRNSTIEPLLPARVTATPTP